MVLIVIIKWILIITTININATIIISIITLKLVTGKLWINVITIEWIVNVFVKYE